MYQKENTSVHILRKSYQGFSNMVMKNLVKDLDNGKVNVYYEQGSCLDDIKNTILDDSQNLGVKLDVIDMIEEIVTPGYDMMDIKDICKQLKELAIKANIPIVVTSDMLLNIVSNGDDYSQLFRYGFDTIIDIRQSTSDKSSDKISEKVKKVTFNVIHKNGDKIEPFTLLWLKDYCRFIENDIERRK